MHVNFGYPWWLSYGHLPIVAVFLLLFLAALKFHWRTWLTVILGVVLFWSSAAFIVARFVIDINGTATLPTQAFLPSDQGRILDIGAGTGRSTIMVLESRPQTTVVALDLFGDSFRQHFGPGESPQERLLANLEAAHVNNRASIVTADMRSLPFPPASFDDVVSAYAMDHLNRDGSIQALNEAARVTKPGGEFLLMLVANEPWIHFAFGPLMAHMISRGPSWWTKHVGESGFQILEQGTRPATFYILARRL